jgi:hypothetical protein
MRKTSPHLPTLNGALADLRRLVLRPDILREESPRQLALLLPEERGRGLQHRDRITVQARSAFSPAPGVIAAPAGGVALRQAPGGCFISCGEGFVVPRRRRVGSSRGRRGGGVWRPTGLPFGRRRRRP